MSVIAQDAHLFPYSKQQYSVLLPAGKTMDAIVTLSAAGYIPLFDRSQYVKISADIADIKEELAKDFRGGIKWKRFQEISFSLSSSH